MSVRFGHAVMDENGKNGKDGAQIGDQTGKEIAFRSWYKSGSGWQYLLVPKHDKLGAAVKKLSQSEFDALPKSLQKELEQFK